MSYKKEINTNHPFAEPLYGNKQSKKNFSVIFDGDDPLADKHPLFRVDSGLPKSLGEALGDLNPTQVNRAILSLIYTMRTLKVAKNTAKTWLGMLRSKASHLIDKYSTSDKQGVNDTEITLETLCKQASDWTPYVPNQQDWQQAHADGLLADNKRLQKNTGPMALIINQLLKNYIKDIELLPDEDVEISEENAKFIQRLNNLGVFHTHHVRRLPLEKLNELRDLIDYTFEEDKFWSYPQQKYTSIERAILRSQAKEPPIFGAFPEE